MRLMQLNSMEPDFAPDNGTSTDDITGRGTEPVVPGLGIPCNGSEPWGDVKTALVISLATCSFVTTVGNLLVIIAFVTEKRLRTNFNLYLFNLAITDLLVSISATPLYTIDYALCRWPFDEIACGVWIFMDWGMTFESIFTLVAISVDRYWAACWSTHYRTHNNRKRTIIVIVITWVALFVVWVPPFIKDRVLWSMPGKCIWEIEKNKIFSIIVSILGYHGPSILILLFYIKVVLTMVRLSRSMARKRAQSLATAQRLEVISSTDSTTSSTRGRCNTNSTNVSLSPGTPTGTNNGNAKGSVTPLSYAKAQLAVTTAVRMDPDPCSEAVSSVSESVTEGSVAAPYMIHRKKSRQHHAARGAISRREKKIFASLSVVVIAYLICWLPWHIVFDLVYFDHSLVSPEWYTFAALLTYVNSALNPILYAFANQDFRDAFKRILTCGWYNPRKRRAQQAVKK